MLPPIREHPVESVSRPAWTSRHLAGHKRRRYAQRTVAVNCTVVCETCDLGTRIESAAARL